MSRRWTKTAIGVTLGAFVILVAWFVVSHRSTTHLTAGLPGNEVAHYSYVGNKRFKTVVAPKDLDDTARWDGISSPRLALDDALRIARAKCVQVEASCGSWSIREAGIQLFVPNRYYYLITLTTASQDVAPGNGISIVVFMNGQAAPLSEN